MGIRVFYSAYLFRQISEKIKDRHLLISLYVVSVIGFIIFVNTTILMLTLLGFLLFFVLVDVAEPLWLHYFNKFVPTEKRATINSVNEMVSTAFVALGSYIGYGLISEKFSLLTAFYIAIVIFFIGIISLFLIKEP